MAREQDADEVLNLHGGAVITSKREMKGNAGAPVAPALEVQVSALCGASSNFNPSRMAEKYMM